MKKSSIAIGILVFMLLLIGMNGCSSYNNMVEKNETVTSQWQQVENQYQRRMDLIPNIVNTVQGQADFEKSTLQAVIEARASATQIKLDPSKLDEASMQKFEAAQAQLSGALSRLLAVAENYPNLQTNQGFSELRTQLEGTENRIANERMKFNMTAQDFNTYVQKFPKNIWAGLFGFNKRAYFEMKEGADTTPTVKFNFDKKEK
jgi:LemA protein